MNILNKTDLFHALFDAFRQHTDSVYFERGANPYRFFFKGEPITVFIGNIHSARRLDQDEYRIQCPGHLPATLRNLRRQGDRVFVLGFSADVHAFSAWDPDRFLKRNQRRRFSIYTRLSVMQEATLRGFSTYTDTNGQNVIMLRPELLGLYVENSTALHQVNATDEELQSIAEVYSNTPLGQQPPARPIVVDRQRIRVNRTQYSRSPRFRQEVLRAYSHRCAMCGIQLDLVDAAHIVPHAHPEGSDIVNNGLALCALHHRSFDTGLLYVREDYSIQVNPAKISYLESVGRIDGLEQYTRQLRPELLLPDNYDWLPAPDNLTLGNDLRGVGLEG